MPPDPTRADLARELLLYKMREYSQDGFCASWLSCLEVELWQLATNATSSPLSGQADTHGFPSSFYREIHQLALIADGWWGLEVRTRPRKKRPGVYFALRLGSSSAAPLAPPSACILHPA
jgi:hypothetical protein